MKDHAAPSFADEKALARTLAVAVMVGCLALPIVIFGEMVRSPAHEAIVSVLCGLTAAFGASLGARMHTERASTLHAAARTAALVTLFLATLAGSDVLFGNGPAAWGIALLAALSWLVGLDAGRVLAEMDEPLGHRLRPVEAHRQLFARFLAGGFVLFVAAGMCQMPARYVFQADLPARPPLPTGQFAVAFLGYFLTGIVLTVHARYTLLSTRWQVRDAAIALRLRRRWATLAGVLTGIAAGSCLVAAMAIVVGTFNPLFTILGQWAAAAHSNYFANGVKVRVSGARCDLNTPLCYRYGRRPKPHHIAAIHHSSINVALLALDILIVLAVLAIVVYLSRRWLRARWLKLCAWLRRLAFHFMRRYGGSVFGPLGTGGGGKRGAIKISPWKRVFPGLLSPRERVLHDYQQMLWRAERQGIPRQTGQTPIEFGAVLIPALGAAGRDVNTMTAAFLEARFSLHPVNEQRAGTVRQAWNRVRAALRALRREPDA
jgi:hypothetical protein